MGNLPDLKNLVAFLVLMEGNGGILNKAPRYIAEKWNQIMNSTEPEVHLDIFNQRVFNMYFDKWLSKGEGQ